MVLKLPAILPSGSAGKFLKKIWNLEKKGGEEGFFSCVGALWGGRPAAGGGGRGRGGGGGGAIRLLETLYA